MTLTLTIDPDAAGGSRAGDAFDRYLATKGMQVRVWDADTCHQVGSMLVDLRGLRRKGRDAVQTAVQVPMLDPAAAASGEVMSPAHPLMCSRHQVQRSFWSAGPHWSPGCNSRQCACCARPSLVKCAFYQPKFLASPHPCHLVPAFASTDRRVATRLVADSSSSPWGRCLWGCAGLGLCQDGQRWARVVGSAGEQSGAGQSGEAADRRGGCDAGLNPSTLPPLTVQIIAISDDGAAVNGAVRAGVRLWRWGGARGEPQGHVACEGVPDKGGGGGRKGRWRRVEADC